ncbi:DUF4843 domain-containing protein [uncultured Bacteroides sp.]|jgi:hypothetical protein|uniref:DUF4843 domain-containing protein n=1 Tax=uncultured Bacteroides sp. TaxID=162156 RepID=UPI002676673E|nr:DUF4843 domain-containing protein [uncultured Bacteroides sp.]
MKPYILLPLFVLCLFSCAEDEIQPYHGEQYLYFSELMDSEDESVNLSFNNYPLDDELTVKIALGLVGDPFDVPVPYKITVVAEKTTALAENYELPENPMFKANAAEDIFELKLKKTDALKEDVELLLKIDPNEYFAGSLKQYETIKIVFNNVESKPLWWDKDTEKVYLGTYSRKKYEALIQYGGEEALNFGELNSAQKRRCALRLKEAIEKYNLTEENGTKMTVPIY